MSTKLECFSRFLMILGCTANGQALKDNLLIFNGLYFYCKKIVDYLCFQNSHNHKSSVGLSPNEPVSWRIRSFRRSFLFDTEVEDMPNRVAMS